MTNEITEITGGQIENVFNLLSSSISLQIAIVLLIAGMIIIATIYKKFSFWIRSKRFNYTKPHLADFLRVVLLPCFALVLISSINVYVQLFEPFNEDEKKIRDENGIEKLTPHRTFVKIINTINVLIIGYTISQLIPIILNKRDESIFEHKDFDVWKAKQGFDDDEDELFFRLFEWVPPKSIPNEITTMQFKKHLMHVDGQKFLQNFRTSNGLQIGSYKKITKNPFSSWRSSEDKKYLKYYNNCINGNNKSGKKLKLGAPIEEIYNRYTWAEERRTHNFEILIPGSKIPGSTKKLIPTSVKKIIPPIVFSSTIIGVISWWGIDLVVLATATGGLALGIGLALKETVENYFAYILIRKDKMLKEDDMIKLDSNYRGYVHKITPRITYVRHPLNESLAIIPTKMLVSNQVINYTKEVTLFPVVINIGVSYLNDPKQVVAILMKVGNRAMLEIKDHRGIHLIRQNKCPYVNRNKQSCGCDKDININIKQPVVRFNKFNDSSLDFTMWIYVKEYKNQFKVKSDIHIIMFEEFKKYEIKIPWPIRTIYQSDEKLEAEEIAKLDEARSKIIEEFGVGDLTK